MAVGLHFYPSRLHYGLFLCLRSGIRNGRNVIAMRGFESSAHLMCEQYLSKWNFPAFHFCAPLVLPKTQFPRGLSLYEPSLSDLATMPRVSGVEPCCCTRGNGR